MCDNCPIGSFSTLSLLSHEMTTHEEIVNKSNKLKIDGKFHCDQCAYSCSDKRGLNSHLNAQHTFDDKMIWYKCDQCNWRSKYLKSLRKHWNYTHSIIEGHLPDHLIT